MSNDANLMSARPDFPDWFSPMLVKELRQGMRSRVFLFCFLALQVAMIFPALTGLLNASIGESTTSSTVFFWLIVCVPLMLVMPSSGLGAISREKTANTLEPIFLTRLTARRILFGKWVALVGQTLLLIAAILPYSVLRYYLGGVNLATELQVLGYMVAGSALLSAVTIGVSPVMGKFGRIIVPIAIIIAIYITVAVVSEMEMGVMRPGSSGGFDWNLAAAVALQGIFGALLMLEVGAGKIGPVAENHSTPKRFMAVASVLTAIFYSHAPGAVWWMWLPAVFIAAVAMIEAVCEPIRTLTSVYRPFVRWGVPGRVLGRLLYPGWPAGFFFSLLLLGMILF
jgi:ABC-type transport system involved in multi-copper enzyme maturation permease subunit